MSLKAKENDQTYTTKTLYYWQLPRNGHLAKIDT